MKTADQTARLPVAGVDVAPSELNRTSERYAAGPWTAVLASWLLTIAFGVALCAPFAGVITA